MSVTPQIGDVFYRIERNNYFNFRGPCRVCEGTRKLTVNEITFDCPMCDKEIINFTVYGYKVSKYKVYSIEEQAVSYENWKLPTYADGTIKTSKKYSIFKKTGPANYLHSNIVTTQLDVYNIVESNFLETEAGDVLSSQVQLNEDIDCIFTKKVYTDYKLAVKIADMLSDRAAEKVKLYNEEHGTKYEIPTLRCKHDTKN